MQSDPDCTIFLLVNTASGGGVGKKLLSQQIQKVQFTLPVRKNQPPRLIFIYFFDLVNNTQKAFTLIKQAVSLGRKVKAIVCGGDGTIMWVVSQLHKHQIDPIRVSIGVLPLGTGNDFSQNFGWGKQKTATIQNQFRSLKKLIKKWMVATQEQFDIWEVKAEVFEYGKFQKINKQSQSQVMTGKVLERSFCNYFSFGLDGKIGYAFDRRRTSTRIGNLIVYGAMGLIKAASKTKSLNDLVQKMVVIDQFGDQPIQPQGFIQNPKEEVVAKAHQDAQKQSKLEKIQKNTKEQGSSTIKKSTIVEKRHRSSIKKQSNEQSVIFTTKIQKGDKKQTDLSKEYYNLLVLNINSFMGGVSDIWQNADQQTKGSKTKQKFHATDSSDGQVQVLCFQSGIGMAMQRMVGGFAKKIAQGSGPYLFTFKQNKQDPKHRTYLQIDGEFVRITHPKSVLISKSCLSPTGKIRVLRRNLQAQQQMIVD